MSFKFSAIIITYNEAKNIARCIEALLPIADEIIILDAFSTDETKAICSKYPVKFEQKEWMGYSQSKNYANSLASNDWLFSVDADEIPDKKLTQHIEKLLPYSVNEVYTVNRLTNYCGKWIKHSGWFPDFKIRIFNRLNAKWTGAFVHETLEFEETELNKVLPGYLLHYSYNNYAQHRERADKYSLLTAKKLFAKGKKASVLKPYFSAIARFVSMYVVKLGFLDGKMGFKIAQISAQSNVIKYKELRRLNVQKDNKSQA